MNIKDVVLVNERFGGILKDRLNRINMTVKLFASNLNIDRLTAENILTGNEAFTYPHSFKDLDRLFGTSEGYWYQVYNNVVKYVSEGIDPNRPDVKLKEVIPHFPGFTLNMTPAPVDLDNFEVPKTQAYFGDPTSGLDYMVQGHEYFELVDTAITISGLQQGIIGISLSNLGTREEMDFYTGLVYLQKKLPHLNFAVLPTPTFDMDNSTDVESLSRRVERDGLDGIRYNRIFFAVYQDYEVPDLVRKSHDLFMDVEELHGRYQANVSVKEKK
ncbi:hypothetical protein OBP_031 [Pseudomonas phage OBP]|uniref:plasmid antitoxin with HTH domain n=1 Tax=Pseudomonas phage OBP TaxID=1124849 RepID=UPI000240D61C|nr:plasmid antitoxin with HTH domain [Pseudomonas phage OBP]AEV89468.1 hypothetical protein OBP_031 [Pseudomonas phage OBP]